VQVRAVFFDGAREVRCVGVWKTLMAKVRSIAKKPPIRGARPQLVHQFLVVLIGIDPLVWRRIQVPTAYSFWDLHVAIQDAMGWLDYHLHEFRLLDPEETRVVSIGIPTEDQPSDRRVLPGWEVPLSRFFVRVRLRRRLGARPCP
jgi:hypothetical protein